MTFVAGVGNLEGVFRVSGGAQTLVALLGDTAPGTGGGTYSYISTVPVFSNPQINDSGDVAFYSDVTGGSSGVNQGIFLDSGGTDTAIALPGNTAPGTGGGVYQDFPYLLAPGNVIYSINDSDDVAFVADVSSGTTTQGVFVHSGGTDTAIALVGDTAPGTGGGTYSGLYYPSINSAGDVTFGATLTGGTVSPAGVFLYAGGMVSAIALPGDEAPGTGGGTYDSVSIAESLNHFGTVVYGATAVGGTTNAGLFVDSGGTDAPVVLSGETAPGTGGGTYSAWDGSEFPFSPPDINVSGDVVFLAGVTGGSVSTGVFKAVVPSQVPALGPYGLALVCLVLAITTFLLIRGRALDVG